MKPLVLTMAAFGPYLAEQTIDFERLGEHGLFLIHGRTGSGKSSILDALCFALFGETTGGERDGQDMVTTLDRGAETKVTLDFEHDGARYRVTRYPTQEVDKVRGDGRRTRQTEATLENITSGEVLAAKASHVTTAVKEMLRCDVTQFRQTVVLPQGDFRRVVTDDGSRREILARIFRTERFALLAERLKEYAKGLAQQGRAVREQRERLLEELGAANRSDIVDRLASAEDDLTAALAARTEAVAARDAALENRAAGASLAADFGELAALDVKAEALAARTDSMTALKAVVERATAAASLADLRRHLDQRTNEHQLLTQRLAAAEAELVGARDALAAAQADVETLESTERANLQSAEALHNRLSSQRDSVAGVAEKQSDRQAKREELAVAEQELRAATEADDARRVEIKTLEDEADALAGVAGDLESAREAHTARREDLEAAGALATLLREVEEVEAELADLAEVDAKTHLDAAVTANAPGLLASTLTEGEPCPVCGSVHHPAPSSSEDVEALAHAFEAFGKAAALAARHAERRNGLLVQVHTKKLERGWAEDVPGSADLENAAQAATERWEAAKGAKARIDEVVGQAAGLREKREANQTHRTTLAQRVSDVQGDIQRLSGVIEGALQALPEEFREPAAFEARLEETRLHVERLRKRFTDATNALNTATTNEAKAATATAGIGGELLTATEQLADAAENFAARLTRAGFADHDDYLAAVLEPDELVAQQKTVTDHDRDVADVAAGRVALEHKVAGKERPDLAALDAVVEAATTRFTQAQEVAAGAERQRDKFRAGHERFVELEGRDASLAQRRSAAIKLDQLANGQLAGRTKVKLETFVLQSIFHEVLEEGNRHLRHMTGGRYTLLLRETAGASASGLELDVRDNAAGSETRPVATLSGGEGFLASLALALGLSEVAQRRSGGLELGALFIDEGFGSLDPQALDQVVDILRALQDGHRLVGVISHVEELKRRIPAQLHVVPGRTGSRVEMRLND